MRTWKLWKVSQANSFLPSCRESDCFLDGGEGEGWGETDARRRKEAMADARERNGFSFPFLRDFIADKKRAPFIPLQLNRNFIQIESVCLNVIPKMLGITFPQYFLEKFKFSPNFILSSHFYFIRMLAFISALCSNLEPKKRLSISECSII